MQEKLTFKEGGDQRRTDGALPSATPSGKKKTGKTPDTTEPIRSPREGKSVRGGDQTNKNLAVEKKKKRIRKEVI